MNHPEIIQSILSTASMVSNIYCSTQHIHNTMDLKNKFTDPHYGIAGWIIQRTKARHKPLTLTTNVLHNLWKMRGFVSIHEASQSAQKFQEMLLRIEEQFRSFPSTDIFQITLDSNNDQSLYGILCHTASFSLEIISYNPQKSYERIKNHD